MESDDSACGTLMADLQSVEVEEIKAHTEIPTSSRGTMIGDGSTASEVGFQLDENVVVIKESACFSRTIHTENGSSTIQDEIGSDHKNEDEGLDDDLQDTQASTLSGSKRPRESNNEEEATVQVIYKSLTGDSRKKLEELLQQWSQWHAKHCSSRNYSGELLESGEEIYFPALQVSVDKTSSTVSFWLDTETRKKGKKDLISFNGNSVPVYDRGFSLALTSMDDSKNPEGLMVISESRCFNCGSFNHALKDCTQPRDNVAVNNARKQHNSKRNQTPGSRNSSRYYQESVGGKYDGLRPGFLDTETRKALGIGMFDPPPWLNRMREIGYPPGYMDEDEEDLPSGIIIFDGEEKKDGEISEKICNEKPKKKSVDFPGLNAPIPEWADENKWGSCGNSDSNMVIKDHQSYGSHNTTMFNRSSSDIISRGGYNHEQRWPPHEEQRWAHDFGDGDEPLPPGCGPPMSSHYGRYGRYGNGYDMMLDGGSIPWSLSFERSLLERSRRNPLVYDGSATGYCTYGYLSSSSPR